MVNRCNSEILRHEQRTGVFVSGEKCETMMGCWSLTGRVGFAVGEETVEGEAAQVIKVVKTLGWAKTYAGELLSV
jgi:hypothetical protein